MQLNMLLLTNWLIYMFLCRLKTMEITVLMIAIKSKFKQQNQGQRVM